MFPALQLLISQTNLVGGSDAPILNIFFLHVHEHLNCLSVVYKFNFPLFYMFMSNIQSYVSVSNNKSLWLPSGFEDMKWKPY